MRGDKLCYNICAYNGCFAWPCHFSNDLFSYIIGNYVITVVDCLGFRKTTFVDTEEL